MDGIENLDALGERRNRVGGVVFDRVHAEREQCGLDALLDERDHELSGPCRIANLLVDRAGVVSILREQHDDDFA